MSWRYLRTADRLTNLTATNLVANMKIFKANSHITLFVAASLVAAAAVPKLAEGNKAADSSGVEDFDSYDEQQIQLKRKGCPPYGCLMLPRDLYFDEEAQKALKAIRMLQPATATAATNTDATSSATVATDSDESSSETPEVVHQALELLKNVGGEDQATLTLIGYKGGQLTEQINQDRSFVISPYYIKTDKKVMKRLMGVFDGHAKLGERVSEYSVSALPQLLSKKLEVILDSNINTEKDIADTADASSSSSTTSSDSDADDHHPKEKIRQALSETFIELDKTAPAEKSGGCTASVVLQLGRYVYVANAGDSRSMIVTYNKSTSEVNIEYITREDKPDLPEERKRVERMGGQVYVPPPERLQRGASSRVLYVDKETGGTNGLAMSRSIGDWAAGEKGVIPDPTIDVLDITDLTKADSSTNNCKASSPVRTASIDAATGEASVEDSDSSCSSGEIEVFAVSATDGLLDFISVDVIAKTVATSLYDEDGPHPLSACESLITTAASAWWKAKNGRYRDDIAISVSKLSL